MSFYDNLRTPSLDGFEFALASSDKAFGRDVKRHKIINADSYVYEDIGALETAFTVEMAIGGNSNFLAQADAFEKILTKKGTHSLVLPQTGELTVVITGRPRRREHSGEVGIVYFSATFELDNGVSTLTAKAGTTAAALQTSSLAALNSAITNFMQAYTDSAPDFVNDGVTTEINGLIGNMTTALSRIGQDFTAPDFSLSSAQTFVDQITSMFDSVTDYEEDIDFSVAVSDQEETVQAAAIDVVNALSTVSVDPQLTTSSGGSTAQSLRTSNSNAVELFTKIAAISSAAKTVSYVEYDSKQDAIAMREDLLSSMESLRAAAGESGWAESYRDLGSLMAAVNRDVDEDIGRLPTTVSIQPTTVRSSLALAHRLYGSTNAENVIAMAEDIVERNGIMHPSFIPVEDLEVLSNA